MKCDRVHVILDLLTEPVREAREPLHAHPHGEVLPLDVGRAHVLRVRMPADGFHVDPEARRGTVGALGIAGPVDLVQHGVVDAGAEGALHSFQVDAIPVRGQLDAGGQPVGQVVHERVGRAEVAATDEPRRDKLRVGIKRDPGPHVASHVGGVLRGRHVLLLGIAELPDLVALNTAARQVPQRAVLIGRTRRPEIGQELEDRRLRDARHAGCGVDAVPFDQGRHDAHATVN